MSEIRIWKEKIMLLLRIKSQDPSSLARQIYEEGKSRCWPGLGKEVSQICSEIGIPDVNDVLVTKADVKQAKWEHHDMKW